PQAREPVRAQGQAHAPLGQEDADGRARRRVHGGPGDHPPLRVASRTRHAPRGLHDRARRRGPPSRRLWTHREKIMDPIKFGTDGWRGVIARDFTFENVRRVAQAIADYVKEDQAKNARKKTPLSGPIVIGFDKRFQSDMFAREIAKVLEANHLNPTLMAESLPTPAVSFMTSKLGGAGVMVTASHNPPSYNGVKIKIDGRAALENVTQGVESWIDRTAPTRAAEIKTKSFRDQYLGYLKSRVDMGKIKSKLKKPIVVDYMHGAASGLMADLLPSKHLVEIRSAHDPLFGGVHPEPIEQYLGALSEAVKKNKAMIGLALDGDADRFGLVDENGRYLTPCQVFP